MIEPTVGRSLHYFPSEDDAKVMALQKDEPCAAILAGVQDASHINLCVFDVNGNTYSRTSVLLVQEGEVRPKNTAWAGWMPYQNNKPKEDAKLMEAVEDMSNEIGSIRQQILNKSNT